jgi:hypothetical protein
MVQFGANRALVHWAYSLVLGWATYPIRPYFADDHGRLAVNALRLHGDKQIGRLLPLPLLAEQRPANKQATTAT